jgi:hypothetical protein
VVALCLAVVALREGREALRGETCCLPVHLDDHDGIRRYRLIIIDEVGYIPFDQDAANLFFQLVASRYEQASIMVTSNLPFGRWGETFSDDVVAAAMIDRLVHHAEVLRLSGDSYRTRARRELLAKDRSQGLSVGRGHRGRTSRIAPTTASERAQASPECPASSMRRSSARGIDATWSS